MLAAKCGRAESIVKYRSGGLLFKNPNMQSATGQDQESTKNRTKTSAETDPKKATGATQQIIENRPKTVLRSSPGGSRRARALDFWGPGALRKKRRFLDPEKINQKSVPSGSGAILDKKSHLSNRGLWNDGGPERSSIPLF